MTGEAQDEGGRRWLALGAVNLAAVIFGAVALFGRLDADPVWIVAGRSAFAVVALLLVARIWRAPLRLPTGQLAPVMATGALLAAHWVSFFAAVQMAGVAVGTLTMSTFPLFTILIEAVRARRRPEPIELAAGVAIIGAVWLLAGPGLDITAQAQVGALIGIGSAALFAIYGLASQAQTRTSHPVTVSIYQNGAVVLVLTPALPFTRALHNGPAWLAVAALGIIGTALVHQLYLYALKRLPAAVCGAIVSLEPIYAIAFAALLFAEPIGPPVALSAALIVGASVLLLRRPKAAPI